MKKLFTIALGLSLAGLSSANAEVFRVNNKAGAAADFTTIQAAHDHADVDAGDTLYIESSPTAYGNLTASKALVYIGPGYYLNGSQQVHTDNAQIGSIVMNASASRSQMMGLYLTSSNYISASNVVFKRNLQASYIYLGYQAPVSNIIITQSYNVYVTYYSHSVSNVSITNNFIQVISLGNTNVSDLLVYNNVFDGSVNLRDATVYNNIMRSGSVTAEGSTFSFNMGNASQFNPANAGTNVFEVNNIHNVDLDANVFLPSAGNPNDRRWQLRTDVANPAIGSGFGGGNMGMYAGSQPYVISGIPPIPAVYFFNTTGVGNNTVPLNVTTKVRSHN